MLGCCASSEGPDSGGAEIVTKFVDPGDKRARENLGKAQDALELGLHRVALRAAEAALTQDPENVEALRQREEALGGLGPREKRPECILEDGARYTGEWRGVKRDGGGRQEWADGSVFEGSWFNDKPHGMGTFTRIDGAVYDGEWKNGMAHGRGSFTRADGSVYDGDWEEDAQHGRGTITWKGGAAIVGDLQGKDRRRGLVWKDGQKYEDGQSYEGQWVQSRMHGEGVFRWPDGSVFRGRYDNDMRHGRGTVTTPDEKVENNVWAKGRRQDPPSPRGY